MNQPPSKSKPPPTQSRKRKKKHKPAKRMNRGAANRSQDGIRNKLLEDNKFPEFAAIEDCAQREAAIRQWCATLDMTDGLWGDQKIRSTADQTRFGTAAILVVTKMMKVSVDSQNNEERPADDEENEDSEEESEASEEHKMPDDLVRAAITSAQRLKREKNPSPAFVDARAKELASLTDKTFVMASTIGGAGGGLFTRGDIKVGEKVATYGGQIVTSMPETTGRVIQLRKKRPRFLICDEAGPDNAASFANTAKYFGEGPPPETPRRNNTKLCITPETACVRSVVPIKKGEEVLVPYGPAYGTPG